MLLVDKGSGCFPLRQEPRPSWDGLHLSGEGLGVEALVK